MQSGTIARVTDKGFGFIAQEGVDKDLFFHASDLVDIEWDDLKEGENVQFEEEEGDRGPKAVNIQRAGGSDDASSEPAEATEE